MPELTHNVNTTHLLSNHDNERGQSRATQARDGEELDEASDVARVAHNFLLDIDLSGDVV
jgi:hypothetical protein